jgi:L-lactate dehydrogenase
MLYRQRKVVVIGAGAVGSTYIYALMHTGLAGEIVIVDIDKKRVEGEVMDLSHGLSYLPPVVVRSGDYSDCKDASLIVLTAGAKQTPGQSRLELIQKNTDIIKDICGQIKETNSNAVFVMVANPVDPLTYTAIEELGRERGRVFGSGTVLDSARFRYALSRHCGIDAHNIHGYILGEHGDSEVPAWSMTHIAGMSIRDYCPICGKCSNYEAEHKKIAQQVKDSAYHIIDYKGATYYAVGLALVRISGAVLRDEHSVLTVSTLMEGEYGLEDVCLSVPCVVSEKGIEKIITANLTDYEKEALEKSSQTIKQTLEKVK